MMKAATSMPIILQSGRVDSHNINIYVCPLINYSVVTRSVLVFTVTDSNIFLTASSLGGGRGGE